LYLLNPSKNYSQDKNQRSALGQTAASGGEDFPNFQGPNSVPIFRVLLVAWWNQN
jgi:hypothetical protein